MYGYINNFNNDKIYPRLTTSDDNNNGDDSSRFTITITKTDTDTTEARFCY